MEIFLVWLLFGILTAVAASNKGRNGFSWLLLGVVLGPFGFILSLLVTKDVATAEKNAISSGTFKKCSFCAELIKHEAIVCRYCGRDLSAPNISASESLNDDTSPVSCNISPHTEDVIDLDEAWKKLTNGRGSKTPK